MPVTVLCVQLLTMYKTMLYVMSASGGPSTWIPFTHVEDPNGIAGSCIQIDLALDIVDLWGVKKKIEDLFSLLSF